MRFPAQTVGAALGCRPRRLKAKTDASPHVQGGSRRQIGWHRPSRSSASSALLRSALNATRRVLGSRLLRSGPQNRRSQHAAFAAANRCTCSARSRSAENDGKPFQPKMLRGKECSALRINNRQRQYLNSTSPIFVDRERMYHVPHQIHKNTPHTIVNRHIDHLLTVTGGPKKAARSQQTEVMAY